METRDDLDLDLQTDHSGAYLEAEEPDPGYTDHGVTYGDEDVMDPQNNGGGNEVGDLAGEELASAETFMANFTACMSPLPVPIDLLKSAADVAGIVGVIESAAAFATGESLLAALSAVVAPEVATAIVAAGLTVYVGRCLGCAASAGIREVGVG
jgi:hypothetical protein